MQRRRLNPLGRAAAQVAWACHAPAETTPVVFASGYGDARRCLQLLHDFAESGAATPTDFTLSVHNAIGAIYSITRGDTASQTSIAAGAASAAAGVVEACALLADGADDVLLVCYEAPLPDDYALFQREPAVAYAWAWRIVRAVPGVPALELGWSCDAQGADDEEAQATLPFGLDALRFGISGLATARRCVDGIRWTWSRHA